MYKKLKAILASEDDGKTWNVTRIFYVSGTDDPFSQYQLEESKPYENMVLERTNL